MGIFLNRLDLLISNMIFSKNSQKPEILFHYLHIQHVILLLGKIEFTEEVSGNVEFGRRRFHGDSGNQDQKKADEQHFLDV